MQDYHIQTRSSPYFIPIRKVDRDQQGNSRPGVRAVRLSPHDIHLQLRMGHGFASVSLSRTEALAVMEAIEGAIVGVTDERVA